MSADETRLDALASSVSDDAPVDWDGAATASSNPEAQANVQAMRDVSRIAGFNRGLQRAGTSSAGTREGKDEAQLEAVQWGELLLLERIGAGANAEVWRAWDPRLQREVALKLLPPRADGEAAATETSPLLDEGRALARVRHPNVVRVYGIDSHDGRVGLWMELLHGRSLADLIEERGALPVAEVARAARELAGALAAVHAAELTHRDVKPANVIIESDGRAVLADFGLGQRRALPESSAALISGTPMFMSPERLEGQAASPRSDLYALGVTLWCALAGSPPFAATTLAELKPEVRRGPARPLAALRPDAPRALVATIDRAMAADSATRFASAAELSAALEAPGPPPATRDTSDDESFMRATWHGIAPVAVAIVLTAIALFVWAPGWMVRRPDLAPQTTELPQTEHTDMSYDVEATLVRRSGGKYERLANGDRVRPGDRLSLEFRTSQPAWVYVLNEDEHGENYLLFPEPRFDTANPVPAESTLVLPGPSGGRENAWTVTSPGGREHFLVIASPAPVPEIEAELKRLPAARPDRPISYAAVPPAAVEHLRGVGGVAPLPATQKTASNGAFERFAQLAGRERSVRGVWVRQVTLENPTR